MSSVKQEMGLTRGGGTVKQIPAWFAIAEIAITAWVILSMVPVIGYAPFWLLGGLSKKRRRPAERAVRAWPLVAVLSLVAAALSVWSAAVFLATLVYGVASAAGAVALWRAPKQVIRGRVRKYSMVVIPALLIAAAYLGYWGLRSIEESTGARSLERRARSGISFNVNYS